MKKSIKVAGLAILIIVLSFFALLWTGIIWRSPKFYAVKEEKHFAVPIMNMRAYDTLGATHKRPYLYFIEKGKGSVYVMGIEHTRDPNDPQIETIKNIWKSVKPDIAFVEGRLGFLFEGLQDPIVEHGEGGLTVELAKQDGIPYFTWEPQKTDELKVVLKHFTPEKAAVFYSLRPYLSNFRFGKPADPDKTMEEYISSRTDVDGLRGKLTSVAQLDAIWKRDFPKLNDWRDTSDAFGWPDGYLHDIFSLSNDIRDIHMCSAIVESVDKGQKVFVTMGSSHAFRIEETLKKALDN